MHPHNLYREYSKTPKPLYCFSFTISWLYGRVSNGPYNTDLADSVTQFCTLNFFPPPLIRADEDRSMLLRITTEVTSMYLCPKLDADLITIGQEKTTWNFSIFFTLTSNGDLWGQGQYINRKRRSGRMYPWYGPYACHAIWSAAKHRSLGQNRLYTNVYVRVESF